MTSREASFFVLKRVLKEKEHANRLLSQIAKENNIQGKERGFLWELTLGIIRWLLRIDWCLKRLIKGYNKLPLDVKILLRMGIYQLVFMDKVPPYSAVDETVKLAKRFTPSRYHGLVNAVLRRISSASYPVIIGEKKATHALCIAYSYPEWLIKKWRKRLSMLEVLQLCRASNMEAPFSIWVNTHLVDPGFMRKELKAQGVECKPHAFLNDILILLTPVDITTLEFYLDGLIYPQDPASSLVVKVLDPKPGDVVLDACAAPGIKTVQMAWAMENSGEIIACEINPERMAYIEENCKRSGVSIVRPYLGDVTEEIKSLGVFFDKILIDAPCSDLGTIRRHPELKWRRKKRDIAAFCEKQTMLLESLAPYLKPEGALVYSVCSNELEEGEELLERFLEKYPDFERDDFSELLPDEIKPFCAKRGFLNLYPHYLGTDGFFIAKIKKSKT